jgi:hypothetical protein
MTDFGNEPITKCLHLALVDCARRIHHEVLRRGCERLSERPDQPARGKVGGDEHRAPQNHAFPLYGGFDGEGGRVEGQATPRIDIPDVGTAQPSRPVDGESVVNERVMPQIARLAQGMRPFQKPGAADGKDLFPGQELRCEPRIFTSAVADCDVDAVSEKGRQPAGRRYPYIDVTVRLMETIEPGHQPPAGKSV